MSDQIHVLRPLGRLDNVTSSGIEREAIEIIERGGRLLLIDLGGLNYISSAGLRMALAVAKRLDAIGGRLALCSPQPQVAEVFEISGIDGILDIHASAEAAAGRLAAG